MNPLSQRGLRRGTAASLLLITAVILPSLPARSEVNSIDAETATPEAGKGHDYITQLNETVNPGSGTLSVRISLPTPKGRGLQIPFSFSYDSGSAAHSNGAGAFISNQGYLASGGGWGFSAPVASRVKASLFIQPTGGQLPYTCYYASNFMFRDPTGGLHDLSLWDSSVTPSTSGYLCGPTTGTFPLLQHMSGGSDGFAAIIRCTNGTTDPTTTQCNQAEVSLQVTGNDGVTYFFPYFDQAAGIASTLYGLAGVIRDRNGNFVYLESHNQFGAFTYQDTLGNPVISTSGFGPVGAATTATNTVTVGGLSYQVNWKQTSAVYPVTAELVTVPPALTSCGTVANVNLYTEVISSIVLPNGQKYQFYYGTDNPDSTLANPYGLLSEIIYPDGAWVKYTWKKSDNNNDLISLPSYALGQPAVPDACKFQYQTPVVATRTVGFSSTASAALEESFVYSTDWTSAKTSWSSKLTKVTATDRLQGSKQALTQYTYGSVYGSGASPFSHSFYSPQIPVEQSVSQYDWGDTTTPVMTRLKAWYALNQIASEETTLATGQTTKRTYCYSGGSTTCAPDIHGLVVEIDEWNFGNTSATPDRKRLTRYQPFTMLPSSAGVLSPLGIWNLPCKRSITDGSGNLHMEEDRYYDGGKISASTLCAPISVGAATSATVGGSAINHDETNYGPLSKIPRGNLSQDVRWVLTGNTETAGNKPSVAIATTLAYDETGQVTSATDARGNTTTYSYQDDFTSGTASGLPNPQPTGPTNAYATLIIYPNTPGAAHAEFFAYRLIDGQLAIRIDENGNFTNFQYNDPMSRLTTVFEGLVFDQVTPTSSANVTQYVDGYEPWTAISTRLEPTGTCTQTSTVTGSCSISYRYRDGIGHTTRVLNRTDSGSTIYYDETATTYTGTGDILTVSLPYREGTTASLITNSYDGLRRRVSQENPDGTRQTTVYDGPAVETIDEGNGTNSVSRISETDGFGRTVALCELASSTAKGGAAPSSCGLSIPGTGFLTTYTYDLMDNLIKVTQGTRVRTFLYDSLNRLISVTSPEAGTTTHTYDYYTPPGGSEITSLGNLLVTTDARGVSSYMTYDALNRLVRKTYSSSPKILTNVYDASVVTFTNGAGVSTEVKISNPIGNRVASSVTSGGKTLTQMAMSYDLQGRVVELWEPTPSFFHVTTNPPLLISTTSTYDLAGQLTSYTDGLGHLISGSYDTGGHLNSVVSSVSDPAHPGTLWSAASADWGPFGPVSILLGNGLTQIYGYDSRGRVNSIKLGK